MRRFATLALLATFALPLAAAPNSSKRAAGQASAPGSDSDQTLRAMHDELERSRTRLALPGVDKPFYIEYRLLDLDVRNVTASFGALVSSSTSRVRYMSVDVRVGNYHLDSSNFVSEDGFQGFLGSTGQVGIDRDYHSLRQDLWLATDQAYKSAVTQMAIKGAFLRSLTKPPEIDDFSQAPPRVKVDARIDPDWTSRNWDNEAREASAALRKFPDLYGTRVNYYLIYATTYLMTSEGATVRTSHSFAAVEAALGAEAADGMPLHNFYAAYAGRPASLPDPAALSKGLVQSATDLIALRSSPLAQDYTGPVLFDAPAAASALAQMLAPSLSGARPPLSATQDFEAFMQRFGGRSEWSGRGGTRVLPASVTLVDDPTYQEFQGQPLLGGYAADDEGVIGQRVSLVENGVLRGLLMSRRPGPDFHSSNGHGRSALLSEPRALSSNLLFQSSEALAPAAVRKKFLDACRDDGHEWCLEIKQMDNPALSSLHSQDFSDFVAQMAGGIASGERMPLLVSRVYVADGREEPVRGGVIEGLTLRSIRNILAIGNDAVVYTYMQNPAEGLAATALGAFGSAQGGIPSTVIAPSLLLDDIEIHGFHGEPRRLPVVPAPPLQ